MLSVGGAGRCELRVKELPDDLADREYRLLRAIAESGLPTAEMVAVVTDRTVGEGLVVTRHIDYASRRTARR